ncbi:PREDICTED: uncharacterized protein LOC104610989 [Nelumbo nucifera]|uniref:Uncharacterized protein LOC104610989 n=1 Tax=Nelumbo nucifera TaxID=4432 RepID=A0A1U8BHQ9_NELNU|nr:PREDICTED: uncharacterized protein LOC104610989 [Nelumbo nucifera]XP_010276180.1 PREDICTED: uncharacterized protein LOC104610989 [Nelumbo nucifera]
MEFHKENSVSGIVPEYGAIFMSNRATKKECFKQKLFGLPFNRADFVKQVKAGMLLFLFEYEKRKLYGVFEACSDGSMNIAPHAFRSSGKPFSAQIHFTTIWKCNPLSEHEFRDAIKDNYYEAYKFNFGLSQDQVHKLLWLFNTKKIEVQRPRILSIGSKVNKSGLGRVTVTENGRFVTTGSVENELNTVGGIEPVNSTRFPDLHGPNLLSGCFNKHIVDRNNYIVQTKHLSTLPSSMEQHSTSHGDAVQPVCTNYPCNPEAPPISLFPLSRKKIRSYEDNLNATIDSDGYIPLPLSPCHYEHTSVADFIKTSPMTLSGLEQYRGLSSYEPSVTTMGLSRENMNTPSFELNSDKDLTPTYVRDCGYHSTREASTAPIPLPNDCQPRLLQKTALQSQTMDFYADIYDNHYHTSIQSDTQNKRASVFSRLSVENTSVNELMETLHKNRKCWRKNARKIKQAIRQHDDENKEIITKMKRIDAVQLDEQTGGDDKIYVEIPLVNFKRRSEMRKTLDETQAKCVDCAESMDVPVKQHKRRKLVRPSFSNVSPCKNGIVSNRCSGNRDEENSGTEESTFKSEGDGDKNLLQKVGMPNVIPPACHGGASGKIEDDSTNEYCQAKGSSQEHFSPEYLLSSAQLSLKKICNMPGCSKGEDNGKWSSQDFGI